MIVMCAMSQLLEIRIQRRIFGLVCYHSYLFLSNGVGERGMLAYLEYMINSACFLCPGDYLLFDGERAFSTPSVKEYLKKYDITPLVLKPPVLHQFLNPCDNDFHSVFKMAYYRSLSRGTYATLTIPEKFEMAKSAFDSVSESAIISMFRRCGLLPSDLDKETIIYNLMFEGLRALGKNNEFHKDNLAAYINWCYENDFTYLYSDLNMNVLKLAGMI